MLPEQHLHKNRVADTPGVPRNAVEINPKIDYLKDTVECKSASCCASVVQVTNENLEDELSDSYFLDEDFNYADSPYYVPPAAIDSTYVHIEPNLYTNFGGLWFDKKNELI